MKKAGVQGHAVKNEKHNGADAAQIVESFGVPTTAKTIIRCVLQLPLPSEGMARKIGIDEWAWKKGQY